MRDVYSGGIDAPVPPTAQEPSPAIDEDVEDVSISPTGIMFGEHDICIYVNDDEVNNPAFFHSIFPELSGYENDGRWCGDLDILPPTPVLELTSDPEKVRRNNTTNIEWTVGAGYLLNCGLTGPGGVDQVFDTVIGGSGAIGNVDTGELSGTGVFTLTCTEPMTDTVFQHEIEVEMVPGGTEV